MDATPAENPSFILRRLTWPVAAAVGLAVAFAWYVTWATSDFTTAVLMSTSTGLSTDLVPAFALLVVMMIAMMLPSALPMVVTYAGLTRLEAGRAVRPANRVGAALFASGYFVVWGLFALVALLGMMFLGILGPLTGSLALVPGAAVLAAGGYQFTRAKDACLGSCQSPMGFVMTRWRSGRSGAIRMGLAHAYFCIGCCWLFMVVLFIAGAMSLLWMGAVSIAIFVEKLAPPRWPVARGIGVLLLAAGVVLLVRVSLVL